MYNESEREIEQRESESNKIGVYKGNAYKGKRTR
jgi:hypothetical protein